MNATETRTTEDRIQNITEFWAEKTSRQFVSLKVVREALADVPREELDAELVRLYRARKVNLVGAAGRWARAEVGRENAVQAGGDPKHLVAWNG
jgi:hypothetical protein